MRTITKIPRLKPRAADAHKGDFGKVCIIAGSIGMSGAAALAGRAALRRGRISESCDTKKYPADCSVD